MKNKKLSRSGVILLFFLVSSCGMWSSDFYNFDYMEMNGYQLSLNIDEMYYTSGDAIGEIEDCSSKEFPKCIKFDSTIIMLPDESVYSQFTDGFYQGKNDELGLVFNIKKQEFNFLGNKIKGYVFVVANEYELITGEPMLGSLKGNYFYSESKGVLIFENNYEVMFNNEKMGRLSAMLWSKTSCGIFSTECLSQ